MGEVAQTRNKAKVCSASCELLFFAFYLFIISFNKFLQFLCSLFEKPLFHRFLFFFFKKNPEDVSNFDEEFTRELPRFSCAKNKRQITETDQLLFKDFDFSSIVD